MFALVTGGNGFVGGAVIRRLLADGKYQARAVVRSKPNAIPSTAEVVCVEDYSSDINWPLALENVSVVIHTAAIMNVADKSIPKQQQEFGAVNVSLTLELARRAAAAGVRRFVFLSSVKVNGENTPPGILFREEDDSNPEDAYAVSKFEAEQALMTLAGETGMEVTIIRPPLVYGPGVKGNFASLLAVARRGVPLPFGAVRDNRRSLVALDNLVDLVVTCIDHPAAANQVFLVSDGEDVSTAELLRRLYAFYGWSNRLFPVPVIALNVLASLLGRRGVFQRLCCSLRVDISKAKRLLGWVPPLTLDEGLRRTAGVKK